MNEAITIIGMGPVGRATAERLAAAGRRTIAAQRSRPVDLPAGVEWRRCDVLDAASVRAAIAGAAQVVLAIGLPYDSAVWRRDWPRAMDNVLAACAETGARMVFVDDLYMYGPQDAPLREDMPLTDFGVKPAVRAEVTRRWMAASATGRVKVAALRAPDFYGPGVTLSHLGETGFAAIAQGRRAMLLAPPDTPHDFAYVPDIARAVVTLLDAPDDAFGQAWHVPSAPIRTPREILALGAAAIGRKARILASPLWLTKALGFAIPMMREMSEMRFLWDRPYRVDAGKFAARFWSDATPFEIGAAETARSFVKR